MSKVCHTCGKPVGFFGKVWHAGDLYHSSCFEGVKPGLMCPVCGDLRVPFEGEGGGLGCIRCKREGRDELYFNIAPKFEVKIGRYVSHECIDTSTRDKSSTEIHLKWEVFQPPEATEGEELINLDVPGKGFKNEALSEVRQGDIISLAIRTDEGRPGPYHFRNLTTGLDYPLHMPISVAFLKHGDHGTIQVWQWSKPHSKELDAALEAATTNLQAPVSEALQASRAARERLRGVPSLVKVYVVLFRSELDRLIYAESARTTFGYSPGATIVGVTPSDEVFARQAIKAVCGDISSMSPAPEVKIERDDGSNVLFNPSSQMESYAVDFLRKKISRGEDPDYFLYAMYNVQATMSTDRLSGDYAIVINIQKT